MDELFTVAEKNGDIVVNFPTIKELTEWLENNDYSEYDIFYSVVSGKKYLEFNLEDIYGY